MADVTGPIASLPGALHSVPAGVMCDDHADRPAVKRVQGETDSFGSEMYDMCQECYDRYVAEMKEHEAEWSTGCCDWCHCHSTDLRDYRDIDEGRAGPVYRVCQSCRDKDRQRINDELLEWQDEMDSRSDW